MKKKLSKRSGLCAILDREFLTKREIARAAGLVIRGGADIIQFRDKNSSTKEAIETAMSIKRIAEKHDVVFIINDRPDVALAVDADGLHVGQGDFGVAMVKKLIGNKILGVSASSVKEARLAKSAGADYLGVGAIFETPVKKNKKPSGFCVLEKTRYFGIPVFAIGGINLKNIKKLVEKGFRHVAVIRAICASRDPFSSAKRLKEALI